MKAIALTVAMVGAALALVAAAVFGLGDRHTLVSPPEAVVENFMRAMERGRFPQAGKHLSEAVRDQLPEPRLAEAMTRLEARIGTVRDVTGEPGWVAGDEAEATAVLTTEKADEVRLVLRLHREIGEWRLAGIEGLGP